MEAEFWRRRWRDNAIGFHRAAANPLLLRNFSELEAAPGARLFLPLCGKTLDIHWLLEGGYRVAGAELVESAVEQLFAELRVEPTVETVGELRRYSAEAIDIFAGDIFGLAREALGPVDAVYDRAALVALPEDLRRRYASHVTALAGEAPQLLVSFVYDQTLADGPPFSVDEQEVRALYGDVYDVTLLETAEDPGGMRGKCPAVEKVWLLR